MTSALPQVPVTRTLPALLRRELAKLRRDQARLFAAKVQAVPDATHVTITYGEQNTVVPRLASYTAPAVGDRVYCLTSGTVVIALGKV